MKRRQKLKFVGLGVISLSLAAAISLAVLRGLSTSPGPKDHHHNLHPAVNEAAEDDHAHTHEEEE